MKKIDRLIRFQLVQKAKNAKLEPTMMCIPDTELTAYMAGTLAEAKKEGLEKHLSECLLCLDKLASSYEGEKLLAKRKIKGPPKDVTWKAKNIERVSGVDLLPKTRKLLTTEEAVIKWLPKSLKKNKWLAASITAFVLSFAFPPVFLQFLLAAGILGGKWIFDSENTKTLIMIYNAWKKGGEKEVGEILEVLKDRIPNKR